MRISRGNTILRYMIQVGAIALTVGLLMYSAATRVLVTDLENSLIRFAQQGATTVETYVTGRISEAQSIAANSIISNPKLPLEQRLAELRRQLDLDIYRRLSIADAEGNSVTTDGTILNISDRAYFVESMKGKSFVTDPFTSRVDNSMVIVFSVPIIHENNVVGVLYATYDADVLSLMTDQIKLNNSGSTYMLSSQGVVIAHDNRELVYNRTNDIENAKDNAKLDKLARLEAQMVAGQTGTGEYSYNGVAKYMGYCPVGDTGWSISATSTKKEVFSKLNSVSTILLGLVVATSFIIAFVMSKSRVLTSDLKRQKVSTLRIAEFMNLLAITIKLDGTILTSNRHAEEGLMYFSKFAQRDIKNLNELLSEEEREKLSMVASSMSGQSGGVSFELALSYGNSRTIFVYCTIVCDKEDDNVLEILAIDITGRVEQENKLQRSFKELTQVYGELAASEDRIRQLAFKDPLTGLPNRIALYDIIDKALNGSDKPDKCALVYMDLDNFKYVNDSFGHLSGDLLLEEIGSRLRSAIPPEDTVARFEGDEFVIFIPKYSNIDEIRSRLDAISRIFNEPFKVMKNTLYVSVSSGISLYPYHATSTEGLIKSSDVAMYRAKNDGKNKHIVFKQEMDKDFSERIDMENGLRKAIEGKEFLLYYQPQLDLRTGDIIGFEALIRWMRPGYGLIAPLKFIGIAEETGLIMQIGRWVLQTACEFMKELNDTKNSSYKVSVNISVVQLMQGDFVSMVKEILEITGFSARLLELELTESRLLEMVELNMQKLIELRSHGVQISIDDFGKGFSSLSYLKQLPIDTLKIDKSFVDDIPGNDNSMIESIIHIGHRRNLAVVAEGVEKREQVEFLARYECDRVQGYYFSKPVPENMVRKLIEEGP